MRAHYSTRRRRANDSVRERWRVGYSNLLFSSHTRARSMFVPETQLLESLSDDESTDLYALSESPGALSRS